MFKLRRWYNQNSKTIWRVTGFIVFLIALIQFFNFLASRNNKNNQENENTNTASAVSKEYSDITLQDDKSVLNRNKVTAEPVKIINEFYKYCNEKNAKKAYELLTDDCKKQMYPDIKAFKKSYYNQVFNGEKRSINIENWVDNTYKVYMDEDALSTGVYDEDSRKMEYITVQKDDEDVYKLNINSYIGKKEINKEIDWYGIKIKALEKDTYMDYEIYTFEMKNNRDNPILIDNLTNINSMYIEDDKGIKYSAYTHELSLGELLINARETRRIKIKYYSKFGSEKNITNIGFSRVIADYNSYSNSNNRSAFRNYMEINIKI